MKGILDWLASLPPVALYSVLAISAAVENVFPPAPADTVVAFGSFLAARGKGSIAGSFLATFLGNMVGATGMYFVGRHYGPAIIRRIVTGDADRTRERMKQLYGRYGLAALFLSRFIPGVRSIVPPFAGAAHIPAMPALVTMGIASAIWYGMITWMAFTVGANWSIYAGQISSAGRVAAIGAAVVLAIAAVVWLVRRRAAQ